QAAGELRDLLDETRRLVSISPPGTDAVSVNAAKVIGQWAGGGPNSLGGALESGAMELEKAADALERSLAAHRNTDDASAARLRQL
ncbi:MAG TPA: hypothetical protein VFO16_15445, partial [Pseudonocardiaceae bacterium]|nr:hypothetical protein [Pseudonocardiaceae bacterium]